MELIQLIQKGVILSTYNIYKACMFEPTPEKFGKKIDSFLNDERIKFFACVEQTEIKGVTVVAFSGQKAEILGIAVAENERNNGIGRFMVEKIASTYNVSAICAETDKDAVGFYRKNGFSVTEFCENFNGEMITRYKCEKRYNP